MLDEQTKEQLLKKAQRANLGLRLTTVGAILVLFVTLGFLVAQGFSLQNQLDGQLRSQQEQALKNHQRTQQYVKCIANVLLKPLSQRTESDFDECGITGSVDTRTQQNASPQVVVPTPPNQQVPIVPVPVTPQPVLEPVQKPATPIEEPKPEEKKILGIPLIDRVLLGLFDSGTIKGN